ncbi:hypothetical protein LJK88_31995 [Paenibacillus sp. P26]|nr:hypothetical protein LJK88_31995 [Paenibacillus sp. P26]
MPDWSYRTLFRPLLFRLPGSVARRFTLSAIGTLSRLPGGSFVIKTLGHMEPSPLLQSTAAGIALSTPAGLAGTVDPMGTAHKAMAQFGFGFMEIGPVTVQPVTASEPIRMDIGRERIVYPSYYENEGVHAAAARIAEPGHALPQFVRLTPLPGSTREQALDQIASMMNRLAEAGADGFYLDILQRPAQPEEAAWLLSHLDRPAAKPLFLYIPAYIRICFGPDPVVRRSGTFGWNRGGRSAGEDGTLRLEKKDKEPCAALLRHIRRNVPAAFSLKASCGVHEPNDALELLEAGADALLLHSGLVFAGPGLPKRVNEAVLHERVRSTPEPEPPSFWSGWGWMCLLGVGMIIGGVLAWLIAATTVLLPYDEAFLGMGRDELNHVNHRSLHFMSHDRITLAGTMISIGVLYFQMARHGLKHGLHWSRTALMTSGIVGFSSFFLYLGFGYFDPLHALAVAVLLPMFILSMRGGSDAPFRGPVNLHNDRLWKLALWGSSVSSRSVSLSLSEELRSPASASLPCSCPRTWPTSA